jgi:hypothetical protein
LRFHSKLYESLLEQIDRVKKNKASMIIIDGGLGEGKTTLAVSMADEINKLSGLEPIKLLRSDHPQIAMGGKEFVKQIRICHNMRLPVLIYDEAGDMNRRGSLTFFNQMINRTFDTYRAFKIIIILCLPSFQKLDKDIFDKRIPRMLINCYDRETEYGNFRVYSLNEMMWLQYYMKKAPIPQTVYKWVTPNYYGHFLNLCPDRSKLLDTLSTSMKLQIAQESDKKLSGKLTLKEACAQIGITVKQAEYYFAKFNIKPVDIEGRTYYYEKSVVVHVQKAIETYKKEKIEKWHPTTKT